ncbi:hypothetical protein D9757_011274 [Collybiopsis confluens]|uniref:SET domain-containing protein n=1 Tax=Collybiopsis confluens TaxID=2823264 RepID=A0A8H5GH15_9AGAR|nr:hypothetical protein D9757_011274 [Collybiopsis confluens]
MPEPVAFSAATMSSSANLPTRRKPTLSITTNSPSKKSRRGSVSVSPLQSSSIGNGASVGSVHPPKLQTMKDPWSGTKRAKNLPSSANQMVPPKGSTQKRQTACHFDFQYRCCSLEYATSGGNSREHPNSRCAAVVGSDIVFPGTVVQHFELEASPTRGSSRHAPSPDEGCELYAIQPVHSLVGSDTGGVGVFARGHIPQGKVILVEPPVVILPAGIKLDSTVADFDGAELQADVYQTVFGQINHQMRKDILTLKDCWATSPTFRTLEGVFRTNSLEIELASQSAGARKHRALFPKTSRCNHSCGPNAIWSFDQLNFTLTLSAVREILPGQEITISYINPFLPRHFRRAHLESKWNFICHCVHCDIQWSFPGRVTQSDKTRHELSVFFDKLPDWEEWCFDEEDGGVDRDPLIEMHLKAMHARAKEGLEGFPRGGGGGNQGNHSTIGSSSTKDVAYMRHIDALVMCYGALADVQGFKTWVRKAKEVKAAEGPDSASHIKVLDMWLHEPRKFRVWGWKCL